MTHDGVPLTIAAILLVSALAPSPSGAAVDGKSSGEQADSVRFVLNFPYPPSGGPQSVGQVVYCGVQTRAEPFRLDVAVSSPSELTDPNDPESAPLPGHDGSGWLDVELNGEQGVGLDRAYREYRVPLNDSFAFGLTLGGRPNQDQLVRITSHPLGDPDGSGWPFSGLATVLAQAGATDPFAGDGRTDNYCLSVDIPGGVPGEYAEGAISTTMPVPDDWVLDGEGSDGGVLAGFPH
jgi:hypothetical protein